MKDAKLLPTEAQEQIAFVKYLRMKGIPHFRVPNETFTHSERQKRINRLLGVSSGVPDLFVVLGSRLVAIEMKRRKGGVLRPSQKRWLDILESAGIQTVVCKGADEAIEFINQYLNEGDNEPF